MLVVRRLQLLLLRAVPASARARQRKKGCRGRVRAQDGGEKLLELSLTKPVQTAALGRGSAVELRAGGVATGRGGGGAANAAARAAEDQALDLRGEFGRAARAAAAARVRDPLLLLLLVGSRELRRARRLQRRAVTAFAASRDRRARLRLLVRLVLDVAHRARERLGQVVRLEHIG